MATKKVMMVTPLDEWPRPPTFVGGGIRWTRSNKPKGAGWNSLCNYFEITWSIAYKKVSATMKKLLNAVPLTNVRDVWCPIAPRRI